MTYGKLQQRSGAKQRKIHLLELEIKQLKEASRRSGIIVEQIIELAIANFIMAENKQQDDVISNNRRPPTTDKGRGKTIYIFDSDIRNLTTISRRTHLPLETLVEMAIADYLAQEDEWLQEKGLSYSQYIAWLRNKKETNIHRRMGL